MNFELVFTSEAINNLKKIKREGSKEKAWKAVRKALKHLSDDPKHSGLHTHLYKSIIGPGNEKEFECYTQNKTPVLTEYFSTMVLRKIK
ncbi:MAG: hypothetical protein AB7T10_04985 [bacterium]